MNTNGGLGPPGVSASESVAAFPIRRFDSRVVLVTGSSRGIGRAVLLGFAREGATVIVNHRPGNEASGYEVARQARSYGATTFVIPADVGIPGDAVGLVRQAVTLAGRLDVVVNNAGICPFHDFLDMPLDLWQRVQDVNHRGTFLVSQAAAQEMVKARIPGRILAMSSISAIVGGSQQAHYNPTKAAVEMLMKCMAISLGGFGITCNSVAPGAIATDANAADLSIEGKRERLTSRIPVGRIGSPEDIVGACLFLASDEARYVTGASILVDGGLFVNLQ
jgi:L-rhamnose 1-dehydrogenase